MSSQATQNLSRDSVIHSSSVLGDVVKSRRLALKLTQPELALAAGCGLRFIVDLEAGKPTVRFENVLRVIEALGLSLQLTIRNARSTEAN